MQSVRTYGIDSLTYGKGVGGPGVAAYPNQTEVLINDGATFVNDGSPGQGCQWFAQTLAPEIVAALQDGKINICIIWGGANDVPLSTYPQAFTYLQQGMALLKSAQTPTMPVITISVNVLNRKDVNSTPDTNSNRLAFNALIASSLTCDYKVDLAQIPALYGADAPDNPEIFNQDDEDGLGKIHLTQYGYSLVASLVAPVIKEALNPVFIVSGINAILI